MSKLKKRLLIAVTLFCSFFALAACSENKIADKPALIQQKSKKN